MIPCGPGWRDPKPLPMVQCKLAHVTETTAHCQAAQAVAADPPSLDPGAGGVMAHHRQGQRRRCGWLRKARHRLPVLVPRLRGQARRLCLYPEARP